MWVAKLVIPTKDSMLVGSKAKSHKVTVMGYPTSHFWKKNKFYILGSIYLVGEEKSKQNFLKSLKEDKRTIKIEMMNKSFGFWLMEQHPSNKMFYDPLIIYVKPIIITNEGDYIFELASWDRNKLSNIAKKVETSVYD